MRVLCILRQRSWGGCVRVSGVLKVVALLLAVAAAFFVLGYFATLRFVS